MRSAKLMAVVCSLVMVSTAAWAAAPAEERLPIMVAGEHLWAGGELSRKVELPTPGVWYIWLKASNPGRQPAVVTWDLDGHQPLHSARSKVLVQPYARSQWVSNTCYTAGSGFRMEVHVGHPGRHTLNLHLASGELDIEKIALTLHFSAKPTEDGETLDHSTDPGGGRARFPITVLVPASTRVPISSYWTEGFREDWQSPPINATGAVYYVDSEGGDDANDGRSPERAWRSTDRVNAQTFEPGDAILLKRGGRWEGGLAPKGSGTAEEWITIGAYGEGARPYIDGLNRIGVSLTDQSYWVIQDLEVTNSGEPEAGSGIDVLASEGKRQPKGIKIYNCIAFDTGAFGIRVGSVHWHGNGYDGVIIENCLAFATPIAGIEVGGSEANGCRNTVIRYCTAYSNLHAAGIWIHSGQNGLIEHCVAYNNACMNIWTWNSINVTIRYCEAFRGRPPRDAGGFDIDWGCQGCTLEYCYSHQNEGGGILLMGDGKGGYRGFPKQSRYNIARYNISEGICNTILAFEHGKVYNNVIVAPDTALEMGGWPYGGDDSGGWPSDTEVYNNILVSCGDGPPMWIDDHATRQNNVFDHNLFLRLDYPGPIIKWGGRRSSPRFWEGEKEEGTLPPDSYDNLDDFREATGQELHGLHTPPMLHRLLPGGKGEIGQLPLMSYWVRAGSAVIGAGRRVELSEEWLAGRREYLEDTGAEAYGIPMEPQPAREDYWGNELGAGEAISIGAHQGPREAAGR